MTGCIQREQNTHSDLGRAIGRMTSANAVAPATTPTRADPALHADLPVPGTPPPAAPAAEGDPAAAPPMADGSAQPSVPEAAPPVFMPVRAPGADADALGTGPPSVDMLPDGVRSWLLLRRSGLPTQSRTTLIGHLDGRCTMARVTRRLRERRQCRPCPVGDRLDCSRPWISPIANDAARSRHSPWLLPTCLHLFRQG